MTTKAPYVVVYHDDPDGLFAAYAAHHKYGNQAEYVPWQAGKEIPSEWANRERELIVLDLGRSAEELLRLSGEYAHVLVIDHHASCADAYRGPLSEKVQVIYDPEQAACVLAWQHFVPREPVPEVVRYIADRDLWAWKLPHSREINAAFASWPQTFGHCEAAIHSKARLMAEGEAICRCIDRQCCEIEAGARTARLGSYIALVATAPHTLVSDAADLILRNERGADLVVLIELVGVEFVFHLRSRSEDAVDVGALARDCGGGGHRSAAGFRLDLEAGLRFMASLLAPTGYGMQPDGGVLGAPPACGSPAEPVEIPVEVTEPESATTAEAAPGPGRKRHR